MGGTRGGSREGKSKKAKGKMTKLAQLPTFAFCLFTFALAALPYFFFFGGGGGAGLFATVSQAT